MIGRPHKRRPCIAARDALRRAAHVDVDDGCARRLGHPGGLAHPVLLATGDLHDVNVQPRAFRPQSRFLITANEIVRGHHFGDDEGRSVTPRDAPHPDIRDARHRREHRAPVETDGSDLKAFA